MQQTLDYLYGLTRFGMKLGLETTTELLGTFQNPQNSYKTIHIAGTNGKGSTAAFIYSILKEAGYKVGIYTSPHLVRFNERIQVDGIEITDEELVKYTKLIKQHAEKNNLEPTFFEFTTAIAFLHFQKQNVDYAVIETGMGGRLDATNVLNPKISVVTNISLDHTKHLGETKLKIAGEKAAIIKEKGILVTGEEDASVLELFENVCKEKKARLFVVNEIHSDQIGLLGDHQFKNAAIAKKVAELLKISEDKISNGIEIAKWSGRLEFITSNVLVDCAHNVAGMQSLQKFIKDLSNEKYNKKVLVLGMAEDKEISKMVGLIVPLFETVILTQGNYKPASLEVLEEECLKHCENVVKFSNVKDAAKKALKLANSENDLILITGSIYMVGDIFTHRNILFPQSF